MAIFSVYQTNFFLTNYNIFHIALLLDIGKFPRLPEIINYFTPSTRSSCLKMKIHRFVAQQPHQWKLRFYICPLETRIAQFSSPFKPPFQFRILKLASSFRIDPIGIEEHTKASIYRHGCSGENASREGGNMDDERGGKEESHVVDSQSRSPPYFFFFYFSPRGTLCFIALEK